MNYVDAGADNNTHTAGLSAPDGANSAVTHEMGHTLGFCHADQGRSDTTTRAGGSLECATTAIMKCLFRAD